MNDLRDRVVVVTGAGSGIGRATALAFAAEGARVHVADVRADRADEVVAAIRAAGGRGTAHGLDVADAEAVEALAARVWEDDGGVDVVHNNAGVAVGKPFEATTTEDWSWIVGVNLWGVVHGCRAFLPRMAARGEGVVVNTASVLGLFAIPDAAAYTTTKFAVVGLSEALDLEYRSRGVRVVALCPGLVATSIIEDGRVGGPADPEGRKTAAVFARRGTDPAVIARDVVAAVRSPRPLVLSPTHAKVMDAVRRHAPSLQRWLARRSPI